MGTWRPRRRTSDIQPPTTNIEPEGEGSHKRAGCEKWLEYPANKGEFVIHLGNTWEIHQGSADNTPSARAERSRNDSVAGERARLGCRGWCPRQPSLGCVRTAHHIAETMQLNEGPLTRRDAMSAVTNQSRSFESKSLNGGCFGPPLPRSNLCAHRVSAVQFRGKPPKPHWGEVRRKNAE